MTTAGESERSVLGAALAVLPILVPMAFIIYWSAGEMNVALAIIRSLSVPNLLFGVSLAFGPVALAVVASLTWATVVLPSVSEGSSPIDRVEKLLVGLPRWQNIALATVSTSLLFLWPFPLAVLYGVGELIIMVMYFVIRKRTTRVIESGWKQGDPLPDNVLTVQRVVYTGFLYAILIGITVFVLAAWLPMEKLNLHDGRQIQGYILSVDDISVTVLTGRGVLETVLNSNVEGRRVCRAGSGIRVRSTC